jgi:ATP adenylyltransferase
MASPVTVAEIALPPDLEERTYAQFDDMVRKGRIFYDHQTEPGELVVDNGFQVRELPTPHVQ